MVQEDGDHVGNYACIDCSSSDGMSVYRKPDGRYDAFCRAGCDREEAFKSNNSLAESYLGDKLGIEKIVRKRSAKKKTKQEEEVKKTSSKKTKTIAQEDRDRIEEESTFKGKGFRGLMDVYNKHFRVRTEFNGNNEPAKRHYPVTIDSKTKPQLVGYKSRMIEDKDFWNTGKNSKTCDLFGQFRCKPGKYILFVAGEEDAIAAYQMLKEDQKRRGKGEYKAVDVVSSSIGEGSAASQAKLHYEFFDGYDNIIVCMDDDEAGCKAREALLDVLPMGKVRVLDMSLLDACKDPCDVIKEGLESEWVSAFYSAPKPKLAGVVSGMEMWDSMVDSVSMPLIPLPPALKPLQDKLCGGLPVGEIINILAASGVGKTTITNMLELFWVFNAPYKVGILSLEAGAGKFLTRLVSGYLGHNIARLETPKAKINYLQENKEKCLDLFMDEDGEERFCLVDDKGELDSLTQAKKTIERMIRGAACEIIVIDPIQDLLDSLSVEEQAAFVGWQKKIKARDGTTFINVNHTRKSGGGKKAGSQGGELTEEDMQGTSALYKSGAVNIIISRNKTAENQEERNTTKVSLPKSRDAGDTGPAGELFFETETAKLYDKSQWIKENNGEF